LKGRAAGELRGIVSQYAAGEAEVVRAYFERPHSNDEHLDVLLRQMGREFQTAYWLHRAVRMLEEVDGAVDRHDFAEFLEQIAEETQHYVLLADLAEWLAGRRLAPHELHRYEVYARVLPDLPADRYSHPRLPEANRMLEVSQALVDALGQNRGTEVARMSEGGGGGAFIECARLTGDPFRERLAEAMARILQDEMHHGPERVDGFAQQWVESEDDLASASRWLRVFMAQHLRVRNEIWGNPLSEDRLAAIDRGEIAPLQMDMVTWVDAR
jgi:hypothetical protein